MNFTLILFVKQVELLYIYINSKGGFIIAKKPTKKELAEMERLKKAERLHNKRADSKRLLIEKMAALNNTLRHSRQIRNNVGRNLHLGISSYKSIFDLAEEIDNLNSKLEDFL